MILSIVYQACFKVGRSDLIKVKMSSNSAHFVHELFADFSATSGGLKNGIDNHLWRPVFMQYKERDAVPWS